MSIYYCVVVVVLVTIDVVVVLVTTDLFTAPARKTFGLNDARTPLQTVYFPVL